MSSKILTRFFPVPKFLQIPMVGFDISSDSIKLIEIKEKRNHLSIERYDKLDLPRGCIEKGDIKSPDILKRHLTEVRKKHGLKYIAVSLPEEQSYVFSVTIPNVSPKEVRDSIELQIEEHIPLPASDVVFDYTTMSVHKETGDITLVVFALPIAIVESYFAILEDAGFVPLVFETEANALARAIIPNNSPASSMIIDLGNTRSVFTIVENNTAVFNVTADFGGADITRAIQKQMGITFEEAEKLKLERGIIRDTKDEIFSSSISTLAVLKDEINKYYSYWNNRSGKDKTINTTIEKIYFCGGASALKRLNEFLSGYLEVSFQLADVWVNVISLEKEVPPITKKESLHYATAIGLALLNKHHD